MKLCPKCGETKPAPEFHKRTTAKDGLQAYCKDCNRSQRAAHYRTAHGRDRHDLTGKRWAQRVRAAVHLYLETHPCVDCGEADPVVLEFDHRDPERKAFTISEAARRGYGLERTMAEIAKCDVRCANCHRRRTAHQFGWAKVRGVGLDPTTCRV